MCTLVKVVEFNIGQLMRVSAPVPRARVIRRSEFDDLLAYIDCESGVMCDLSRALGVRRAHLRLK